MQRTTLLQDTPTAYIIKSTQYFGPLLDDGIGFCDTDYESLIELVTCKDDETFLCDTVILIIVHTIGLQF